MREADVLLGQLERLERKDKTAERSAIECVVETVREKRVRAGRRALGKATTGELRRLSRKLQRVERLVEAIDNGRQPRRAWQWALEARVARRAETLAAAMKDAGSVYLPERLHAVRIALKKLRYAVELADELRGKKRSPDERRLKRAQDILGRLHDVQMLVDAVRQAHATQSLPDVTTRRQFNRLTRQLEDESRRVHARYMRERPLLLAVCQRLAGRSPAAARRAG
jgi:CHAD domain-containing protein